MSLCQVLNLNLFGTTVICACTGRPGGIASGCVHTLDNILLDGSSTIILWWSPVYNTFFIVTLYFPDFSRVGLIRSN